MLKALKSFVKRSTLFRIPLHTLKMYRLYSIITAKKEARSKETGCCLGIGIVCDLELRFLQELVERSNALPGPIIEIGTLFGSSSLRIARWKLPDKKLITVDNYLWNSYSLDRASHFKLTKRILAPLIKSANVIQMNMDKSEFYRIYSGEPPAMVFLDADHSYEETKKDIEWAMRVSAEIICGHDYHLYEDKMVKQAVDEFGKPAKLCGSLWLLRKEETK